MIHIVGETHGTWDHLYQFMQLLQTNTYTTLFIEMYPSILQPEIDEGTIAPLVRYIRSRWNYNYPCTRKHPYIRLYEVARENNIRIIALDKMSTLTGWSYMCSRIIRVHDRWAAIIREHKDDANIILCGRCHVPFLQKRLYKVIEILK